MQTRKILLMIEKVILEDASSWETILSRGSIRSKTVCPCLLLRLSILQ